MTRSQHYSYVRHWFDNAIGTDIRRIDSEYGHLIYAAYLLDALNAPNGARILEIGCGDGVIMRKMAELRPDLEFWGVDISQAMIKKSMLANPESNFLVANVADAIPINETFDIVFSFSVGQYLQQEDVVTCCIDCTRLLRKEGKIFHFAIPNRCQHLPKLINDYLLRGSSKTIAILKSAYHTATNKDNIYYEDGSFWHSSIIIAQELRERLSAMYKIKVQPSEISWFRFDLIVSSIR